MVQHLTINRNSNDLGESPSDAVVSAAHVLALVVVRRRGDAERAVGEDRELQVQVRHRPEVCYPGTWVQGIT